MINNQNNFFEYQILRNEIEANIKTYYDYKKLMYTCTSAFLTVALYFKTPLLTLAPLLIIYSCYKTYTSCQRTILRLGMYIYVFLEDDGISWEKRCYQYDYIFSQNSIFSSKPPSILTSLDLSSSSCILFCFIFFIYNLSIAYISAGNTTLENASLIRCILIISTIAGFIAFYKVMVHATKKFNFKEEKETLMNNWQKIKLNELYYKNKEEGIN